MTHWGARHLRPAARLPAGLGLAALMLVCLCGVGAAGAELPRALSSTVAEVVDGDTVILDGGDQVRLVGIQAPKLPLGRPGFRKWPLADRSKAALVALIRGRRVALVHGGRRVDRWGRLLAHLYRDDGLWIQGEMLRRGLARVYSFPDNRIKIAEMLELERTARRVRKGIWDHPYYQIRTAETARRHTNSFQLVEGLVLRAAKVRGRAYLNFGRDWRRDFTITLSARALRTFEKTGVSVHGYEGRRVRVRGWLKWRNGPAISVTHPEQIEVLTQ